MIHEGKIPLSFEGAVVREMQEVFGGDKHHPSKPTFAQQLKTDLAKCMLAFCRVLCLQADQKQQDYGSENLTQFGPQGVLVRWADKLSRLRNLYESKRGPAVANESTADTWRDGIVYDIIGYLMEVNLWPIQVTEQWAMERRRQIPVAGPDSDTGEAGDNRATMERPPAPAQDSYRFVDHDTSWSTLVNRTLEACAMVAHDKLPVIGAVYKMQHRVPGRVVVDLVLPNYNDAGSLAAICVVFHELNPQAAQSVPVQLPNHLRVEPLCWFDEHYSPE
jgi:hypothetical protein